ncbi:MAG: 16S rRNA (cytosine(1402)-N(4))-methyltransferase, partial [Bacteroidetes bacterium SW_10_40_5]
GNFKGKATKDFYGNIRKPFEQVNRKPIQPSWEETNHNRRAKSAKLRIGKKIKQSNDRS